MNPQTLTELLGSHEIGAGDVLVDWLSDKGFPWTFPSGNITPDEECVSYCRWCRTAVAYQGTEKMIRFYRGFTCTACTPNPSPALLCSDLVGRMTIDLQRKAVEQFGASYDVGIRDDPLGLLEAILIVIESL